MKQEKIQELHETYINGNLDDFKNEIKKLSKKNIFEFLDNLWMYTTDVSTIIYYLANNL